MQNEQAVKMAAKLYECRDTAKRVFGDGYHKRMEAYGQVVKSAANALRCSDIAAATTLANKAGGGMAAICYLAAVVEMTEPSNDRVQARPEAVACNEGLAGKTVTTE